MKNIKRAAVAVKNYGLSRSLKKIMRNPGIIFKFLTQPTYSTYARELDIDLKTVTAYVQSLVPADSAEIAALYHEIRNDQTFRTAIENKLRMTQERPNALWHSWRESLYILIRLTTPRYVIETGVYDGLGSAYILRALQKNRQGILYGLDLNKEHIMPGDIPHADAGWIIPDFLKENFRFYPGDVFETLPPLMTDNTVDMLVSDTGKPCLAFEMELCAKHFTDGALIHRSNNTVVDFTAYGLNPKKTATLIKGQNAGMISTCVI